jgi:hypothetical protein
VDGAERSASFARLLSSISTLPPPPPSGEDPYALSPDACDERDFLQALYTLVRKCLSLEDPQRSVLAELLAAHLTRACDAVVSAPAGGGVLVSEGERSCLGLLLFLANALLTSVASDNRLQGRSVAALSKIYAAGDAATCGNHSRLLSSLLHATRTMHRHSNKLWARGVLDEPWVNIPILAATALVESPATLKISPPLRPALAALLRSSYAATTAATLTSALVDLLCTHAHVVSFLPSLLATCERALAEDVFRDIASTVKGFGNNYAAKSTLTTAK